MTVDDAPYLQPNLRTLIVGAVLVIACTAQGVLEQQVPPVNLEHFRLVGTVTLDLPEDVLLGWNKRC